MIKRNTKLKQYWSRASRFRKNFDVPNHYPVYEYGDILEISGKIRMPVESRILIIKIIWQRRHLLGDLLSENKKIGEASGAVIVFGRIFFFQR